MSDAEGPAKDPAFSEAESHTDPAASPRIDAGARPDAPAGPVEGVWQADHSAPPPSVIGHYRLVRKLGEGGMGQVWLAEQTAPVRRQVALKLIKPGLYDETMVHRFQSERQSLAIMDHPSIAKVFEAGATAEGQPYLVMEYVPGVPITDYCDRKKLSVRERLELFMLACDGVQHAHQKAVTHRDLKPANILVVEVDGKPVLRIIDFGLAKPTTPHALGETTLTQVGELIGTPAYMSPEQANPEVRDIDTRTDVYSLGVLLYELLTGSLPFDPKQWRSKPLDYVLRQIREEDPPRPSTQFNKKASTYREAATADAEARSTDPERLVKLLRGDLDWITMKALEKDRARRYATPSELSADISRYLRNDPVVAGPASTGYYVRKYIVRHRIALGAAAGLLVLLTGFAVAQAIELHRITLERDRATRERNRATRITDFMTSMFKVSDPSEARGNSITAREILDKASKDIGAGLAKDPELLAQMMDVMANVYDRLGLYSQAQLLLERAIDARNHALGPENPDTLRSRNHMAGVLIDEGRYAEAEKLCRELLDIQRRVLGPGHPDTLGTIYMLAATLSFEGRYADAEKLDGELLDTERRVLGPEHADTLRTMYMLATTLGHEGRYGEAEKLDAELLDTERRVLGPEHADTLGATNNLAVTLLQEGRYSEAEKLDRELLDTERRVLGPEHPDTLATGDNLAITLFNLGSYSEAEKLLRETLDVERRVLGPEHPNTLATIESLADGLTHEGHYAEAEKLYRETLDIDRRVLGPEHPDTLLAIDNLALAVAHRGHYAEAEKLAREALGISRRVLGPEGPLAAASIYDLGSIAAQRGRHDEALSLLREAVDHGLPAYADLGLSKDPDLKSLYGDPRFAALVAHAKERAAEARKPK